VTARTKCRHLLAAAVIVPVTALAGGLPRVAPPGPGMMPAPPAGSFGRTDDYYGRGPREGYGATVPLRRGPGPSVLYPSIGGATTDTGVPLSGRAGVLRDPGGGIWNCTAAGCFSPGGTFVPMKKTPRATSPGE
jgi:hypothetical protein